MKNLLLLISVFLTHITFSQTVGKIKAETYQAEFEKKKSIDDVSDYWGETIPIALINISASDVVYDVRGYGDVKASDVVRFKN